MHTFLLLALFQAAPAAGFQAAPAAGVPLLSSCSSDEPVAILSATDRAAVETAIAGDNPTCYKITVSRGDTILLGYVLGESLPAVAAFVRERERVSVESAKEEARLAQEAAARAKVSAPEVVKSTDPLVSTQFQDFNGPDAMGKTVRLSGLRGHVTVVTFWSPKSVRSISELTRVLPLYNQFHKSGLAAIGVSMDPRRDHISEALDDVTLPWSQVADQSGLAAHYQVDPRAGKTFVLDASHRIVAAGPMGPDIIKAVHQLMDAPATNSRN
jgi:peroxiredoxin